MIAKHVLSACLTSSFFVSFPRFALQYLAFVVSVTVVGRFIAATGFWLPCRQRKAVSCVELLNVGSLNAKDFWMKLPRSTAAPYITALVCGVWCI